MVNRRSYFALFISVKASLAELEDMLCRVPLSEFSSLWRTFRSSKLCFLFLHKIFNSIAFAHRTGPRRSTSPAPPIPADIMTSHDNTAFATESGELSSVIGRERRQYQSHGTDYCRHLELYQKKLLIASSKPLISLPSAHLQPVKACTRTALRLYYTDTSIFTKIPSSFHQTDP